MIDRSFHPTRILTCDTNIQHRAKALVRHKNGHTHQGYLCSPGLACLIFLTKPCAECGCYNADWMQYFFTQHHYDEFADSVGLYNLPDHSINWFEAFEEAVIDGYDPTEEALRAAEERANREREERKQRYAKEEG
jgi:hypothetical protein